MKHKDGGNQITGIWIDDAHLLDPEPVPQFEPFKFMMDALDDADKQRLRITHWAVNGGACHEIAYRDGLNGFFYSSYKESQKPVIEREYMGVPMRFMREWAPHDEPRIEAVFERYGRNFLVHDYRGDILHGVAQNRFLKKLSSITSKDTIVARATAISSHGDTDFPVDPQKTAD